MFGEDLPESSINVSYKVENKKEKLEDFKTAN